MTSFRQMLMDVAEADARRRIDKALSGWTNPGTESAMEEQDDALKKIKREYERAIEFIMLNYEES